MAFLARGSWGLLGLGFAGLVALAAQDALGNGGAAGEGGTKALPFAQGQSFETLDAYLAHLETLGTIGIRWYQRRPDGSYVVVERLPPGSAPQIFTRQELLERYGFAR